MKIKKTILVIFLLCLTGICIYLLCLKKPFVIDKTVVMEGFGNTALAQPIWGATASALVFVDASKIPPEKLAKRLASMGLAAAVVDSSEFLKSYSLHGNQCLDSTHLADAIKKLEHEILIAGDKPNFMVGIGKGAIIPLVNTQEQTNSNITNLSIGFSVELPADLQLCPPLLTLYKDQKLTLVSPPEIKSKWRSVWIDKPRGATAIFIKEKLPLADTYIAEYNTPLDDLLVNELKLSLGQGGNKPPMPIIEMPAGTAGKSITLFYSGDGGWRDLDRSVAEQMAKLNNSVLGVDVLRYFWERKTPEQVASDLAATMQFYRSKWGVKSFVLAGFSFGADILPVVYNRLPAADQANVELLVFLALGNHADFEVHVAGWLGQSTHEMPLPQELAAIPKNKIVCIYGKEEKAKTGTACTSLENTEAKIIELPGGHHFDNDYPKLTRLILDNYHQHGIN